MKKLRGGNIVGSIIGGIIKFIIYFVLTICVLMFMIMSLSIIALVIGGYIMLQKLLELINIVTSGFTMAINPIAQGTVKMIDKLVALFKPKGKKSKKSKKPKGFKIPKIPTKPEEIIYEALGIPKQEKAKDEDDDDEEEDDEEYCSAN